MLILAARPAWGDLLKLDISSERSQGCHLFFTIRNRKDRMSGTRAEKPVAFGYISLFGGDSHCLADGMHQVALYRYDPQWTSPGLYLSLPSTMNDKMPLSEQNGTAHLPVPLRDSFAVRSFLCSTEITQDPTLLAILKWKTNVPTDLELLKSELNRLRYCPEHECVKMIRHIFDALFAVLSSRRNENGEVDTPAFSVLITLLCKSG
jgi:dedicator of cytokinesis protein 3